MDHSSILKGLFDHYYTNQRNEASILDYATVNECTSALTAVFFNEELQEQFGSYWGEEDNKGMAQIRAEQFLRVYQIVAPTVEEDKSDWF